MNRCLAGLQRDTMVRSMRRYVQHGRTSTYRHCVHVAAMSYRIAAVLAHVHIRTDRRSMVRGALLHDFYLYDWHEKDRSHRWHGFHHAARSLRNAEARFPLNGVERDIIRCHMWPLNLTCLPRTREAAIVCLADKLCAIRELF